MSNDIVIRAEKLTKTFRLYNRPSDRVRELFHPFTRNYHKSFCALQDVSFTVKKGETLGIVGRNGSGKSTLLQILCGILQPTSGYSWTHGRISAILELGSGFHLEFTGRENVFINGRILGLNRSEIESYLDDILGFANIGEFIDQPVKTYSSGMLLRLAFSIVIHVRPDILIVDEALAVGDEVFKRKCLSKIRGIQEEGRTIIMVSHSTSLILDLCTRGMLLDRGRILLESEPGIVVGYYKNLISSNHEEAMKK
jgi:lipopolysaccharide transport system ATP-binding protein